MATKIKKIIPHLWYDNNALEAAEFYVSVFQDSRIVNITTIDAPPTPTGKCDIVTFELAGNTFMAISAGPRFKFNESVSFMVYCDTQEEIDYFWEKLREGGEEQACGWLKDKFGLSWQIVPADMEQLMQSNDEDLVSRVTQAVFKMVKIDIKKIREATESKSHAKDKD